MVFRLHVLLHMFRLGEDAQRKAVQTVQRDLPPMHQIAHGWQQVVEMPGLVTHEFLHDLTHGFRGILLHFLLGIVLDQLFCPFANNLRYV